jgi:hypothetical protein
MLAEIDQIDPIVANTAVASQSIGYYKCHAYRKIKTARKPNQKQQTHHPNLALQFGISLGRVPKCRIGMLLEVSTYQRW